jgi:hypothetical protein
MTVMWAAGRKKVIMSLFSCGEICNDCKEAVMHDCNNCLNECKKDMEPDYKRGGCYSYDGPDEWKNLVIRDKQT